MSGNEIRSKFLMFMKERGHAVLPSAAIIPENDPTTLFTGSGMQPLVPYLLGETHPKGKRLANSQKCFRAEDIEEVGDSSHTTFFEMLGNWSLGDYFKEEQIPAVAQFYLEEIGLDPDKFYVTAFIGDDSLAIPKDEEVVKLWQEIFTKKGMKAEVAELGSAKNASERGIKEGERIFYYDAAENWWSRAGAPENMPVGEIGGGDSEMFYDFGTEHDPAYGKECHPACDCGRFMEIGNSVFMEYIKTDIGFEKLPAQNVDFGGGLERIAAAAIDSSDMYKVDLLWNTVSVIEKISGKSYDDNKEAFRVITDHIRGAVFMINDGILPSNTEQGYFVRRLLRRAVRFADVLSVPAGEFKNIASGVITTYQNHYTSLGEQKDVILNAISQEEEKFRNTLEKGLKQFEKATLNIRVQTKSDTETGKKVVDTVTADKGLSAEKSFELFTTYGFPIELTQEIARERGLSVDISGFYKLMTEHKEKSRQGAEQKFKGGLADHSDRVVQYHTTTHLLLAALRHFLGDHVHQAGSNITGERLRFDFTHDQKVENSVLEQIEDWVNHAIKAGGSVETETLSKDEAQNDKTIEGSFWDRYPDTVKVYTVTSTNGEIISRELCGGPHVESLSDISGNFRIKKENSSSQGVRRIKGVLTD